MTDEHKWCLSMIVRCDSGPPFTRACLVFFVALADPLSAIRVCIFRASKWSMASVYYVSCKNQNVSGFKRVQSFAAIYCENESRLDTMDDIMFYPFVGKCDELPLESSHHPAPCSEASCADVLKPDTHFSASFETRPAVLPHSIVAVGSRIPMYYIHAGGTSESS